MGRDDAKGEVLGLAATCTFVTYVAAVARVEVDAGGNAKVPRINVVVDRGPVVILNESFRRPKVQP